MSEITASSVPTGKGLTLGFRKTSLQLDPVQSQRALDLYPQLTISEIARMAIDLVIELKPTPKPSRFILTVEDQEAINRGVEILRGVEPKLEIEMILQDPTSHPVEYNLEDWRLGDGRPAINGIDYASKNDIQFSQNCPCGDYGRPGHPIDRWCDEYTNNERNSE